MTSDFAQTVPPSLPEFLFAVAIYSVLPVLLAGAWLLRRNRTAQVSDPAVWVAVAVLPIIRLASIARTAQDSLRWNPIVPIFLLCILTSLGIVWTLVRLSRVTLVFAGVGATVTALLVSALLLHNLFPPVSAAREAARRTQCKSNLKQISFALLNYHDNWQSLPWQQIGDPPQSWRLAILPYLDQQPLFDEYQHRLPWNGPENTVFSRRQIVGLMCPSQQHQRDDEDRWLTSYAVVSGLEQIWRDDGPLPLDKITDGRSNTIAVVEACGRNIVWNEPRDIDAAQTPLAINLPGARPHESPALISSLHAGGGHMAMADGSVRFRSAKIDPAVLKALTTAAGGEPLGEF